MESVVESITDLDIDYKLNGEDKKVEASRILAKSFNENARKENNKCKWYQHRQYRHTAILQSL